MNRYDPEPDYGPTMVFLAGVFAAVIIVVGAVKMREPRPQCAPGWHVVKTKELGLMCTRAPDPRPDLPQERR